MGNKSTTPIKEGCYGIKNIPIVKVSKIAGTKQVFIPYLKSVTDSEFTWKALGTCEKQLVDNEDGKNECYVIGYADKINSDEVEINGSYKTFVFGISKGGHHKAVFDSVICDLFDDIPSICSDNIKKFYVKNDDKYIMDHIIESLDVCYDIYSNKFSFDKIYEVIASESYLTNLDNVKIIKNIYKAVTEN